jgi:hypothetical protein
MSILGSANLYAGKKVIKWIDSSGATHYGDKRPMPSNARQSTELNQYGIRLEKSSAGVERTGKTDKSEASKAKQRHDHSLLSTFPSVNEIEIARQRNIKIDELTLESMKQKRSAIKTRIEKNMQSNSAELSQLQNIELQIEVKEVTIADINERYEENKLRYLELRQKGIIRSSLSSAYREALAF